MKTSIVGLTPILICKDVQASIKFYSEVLGFSIINRMDSLGRSGWASLDRNGVSIMLSSPSYIPEPQAQDGKLSEVLFYFYTEDVVQLREHLVDSGYAPSEFAVRFYQMKEIEVTDPDGHILVFGQDTDEPRTPED